MATPLLDFVPGAEPTTGDTLFVSFITLLLLSPYIYGLFLHIMGALGLYRIAKRRGIHAPWLAWCPVGQDWLLGCISDQYLCVTQEKYRYWRIVLLLFSFLHWIFLFLSAVFTWALPLEIMNLVYNDFLRTFLHTPFVAKYLSTMTTCMVAALLFFRLFPLYRLYQSAIPRYRIPLLILNIAVPFSPALTVFAVRDCDMGMPPRRSIS